MGRSSAYIPGRNQRLDFVIRATMGFGIATVAGCAAAAATAGLGSTGVGPLVLWALCAGALASLVIWLVTPALLGGWPAAVFAIAADLAIGATLAYLGDSRLMFGGCILFALVGGYVTTHVPTAGLVLHAVFAGAFTISSAIVLITTAAGVPDVIAVLGAAVWLWVLVGTPLAVRRVWSDVRTQAELADHDPLTGVLNRAGLEHAYRGLAGLAAADGLTMLVVAVDLDDFKTVNDRYGHAVGDAVIIETTQLLAHHYGRAAAVARCGGEEFTVLAIGRLSELRWLAESTPTVTPGIYGPPTTMSIGVVVCNYRLGGPDPLRESMAAADEAMYRAKRQGGNTISVPGP